MRVLLLCAMVTCTCMLSTVSYAIAQEPAEPEVSLVHLPPGALKRWPRTVVVYSLDSLPIYDASGNKDPSIVMALIEKSIEPTSWNAKAKIVPYQGKLIISQTTPVHQKIQKLLESFASRASDARSEN